MVRGADNFSSPGKALISLPVDMRLFVGHYTMESRFRALSARRLRYRSIRRDRSCRLSDVSRREANMARPGEERHGRDGFPDSHSPLDDPAFGRASASLDHTPEYMARDVARSIPFRSAIHTRCRIHCLKRDGARDGREAIPPADLGALLHPVGIVLLLAVQWYALARRISGKPAVWRGRGYTAHASVNSSNNSDALPAGTETCLGSEQ